MSLDAKADSGHMVVPDALRYENQVDTTENKALFHAALKGDKSEVLKCLQKGGKPNFFFRPEDNKNSLHVAAEKGFLDVVKILLDNGADINAISTSDHTTALILSIESNNVEVTEELIRRGAKLEAG